MDSALKYIYSFVCTIGETCKEIIIHSLYSL